MQRKSTRASVGLVVESIAVVVSILVAFGLDAWWENRQVRHALLESLASVTEEIQANVSELHVESLFQRTAAASIDDLVKRIDDAEGAQWLTMPDTIASFAFVFPPVFDASTGALDALVASGALSRVRDRRLERVLGDLGAQIEDVWDGEMGARRLATDDIVPLFWDSAELESALGRSVEYRTRGLDKVALPSRTIQLPNVAGLKNRLLLRRAWVASSQRAIDRLLADLELALDLLEAEIARGV